MWCLHLRECAVYARGRRLEDHDDLQCGRVEGEALHVHGDLERALEALRRAHCAGWIIW